MNSQEKEEKSVAAGAGDADATAACQNEFCMRQ